MAWRRELTATVITDPAAVGNGDGWVVLTSGLVDAGTIFAGAFDCSITLGISLGTGGKFNALVLVLELLDTGG